MRVIAQAVAKPFNATTFPPISLFYLSFLINMEEVPGTIVLDPAFTAQQLTTNGVQLKDPWTAWNQSMRADHPWHNGSESARKKKEALKFPVQDPEHCPAWSFPSVLHSFNLKSVIFGPEEAPKYIQPPKRPRRWDGIHVGKSIIAAFYYK